MVINNFIQPYYGASYGMNPYAGYSPYGATNPYGSYGYGSSMGAGYSPYGYNPMASTYAGIQSLSNGLNMIVQALVALKNNRNSGDNGAAQSSASPNKATQAKAADDQWQQCKGCSKS